MGTNGQNLCNQWKLEEKVDVKRTYDILILVYKTFSGFIRLFL